MFTSKWVFQFVLFLSLFLIFLCNKSYAQTQKLLGQAAPRIELYDLDGNNHNSDDVKGKVVVLDFWATWCAPCIKSLPSMIKIQNSYMNDPNVIFWYINTLEVVGKTSVQITDFLRKKEFDIMVLRDNQEGKTVADKFGVTGLPVKIIIDRSGVIRYVDTGFTGDSEMLIKQLTKTIEMLK